MHQRSVTGLVRIANLGPERVDKVLLHAVLDDHLTVVVITLNASRSDASHLAISSRGSGTNWIDQIVLDVRAPFNHAHMVGRTREEGDDLDLPVCEVIVREDG